MASIPMKILAIATSVMLLVNFSNVAFAGLREGAEAAKRGDFATAYREWLPLAKQNNATAQYNLGYLYDHGKGVKRNGPKALYWYKKAAAQGHPSAPVNLGILYHSGHGMPRNFAKAASWCVNAGVKTHQWAE